VNNNGYFAVDSGNRDKILNFYGINQNAWRIRKRSEKEGGWELLMLMKCLKRVELLNMAEELGVIERKAGKLSSITPVH
jgi:hypothetical protein